MKESGLGLTFFFVLGFYKYTGFANLSITVTPNAFTKNSVTFCSFSTIKTYFVLFCFVK